MLEVRTTQWGKMTLSTEQFAKLDAMRAQYLRGDYCFSDEERSRLLFVRWLVATGKMTS